MSERLLLVGHGRMGGLVESLAPEFGFGIAGVIDSGAAADQWPTADVAIDFSVLPPPLIDMFRTGWRLQLEWLEAVADRTRQFLAKIPKA